MVANGSMMGRDGGGWLKGTHLRGVDGPECSQSVFVRAIRAIVDAKAGLLTLNTFVKTARKALAKLTIRWWCLPANLPSFCLLGVFPPTHQG
jgi:hypothetical protein